MGSLGVAFIAWCGIRPTGRSDPIRLGRSTVERQQRFGPRTSGARRSEVKGEFASQRLAKKDMSGGGRPMASASTMQARICTSQT
jgi:hypothetical protein